MAKKYFMEKIREKIPFFPVKPLDIKPYAFIRVFNEMRTLPTMLESILPAVDRGVIGTHLGNTDGTKEYCQEFCKKHPGFIFFEYPHRVIPGNSKEYLENPPFEHTLAAYYNAVMNLIPDGEWLIKLDADQIYDPIELKKSFTLPWKEHHVVVYPRLNVHCDNGELKALNYVFHYDQWLLYKHKDLHFVNHLQANPFEAWEILVLGTHRFKRAPLSTIHYQFEKPWRPISEELRAKLLPLTEVLATLSEDIRSPTATPERILELHSWLIQKQQEMGQR